jgi:hypothetical protein
VAVVLEGWGIVARRAAVEAALPGGLSDWFVLAPNRVASADHSLCVVGFMVREDAAAFLLKLEEIGVATERQGVYRDAALMSVDGPWEHECTWLRVGRYAGVRAVWMDGVDPEPLVVPLVWSPNSIINISAEEAARRFKYLRTDGGLEVFLDTETGEEIYRGRTTPRDVLEPEIERRFKSAVESINPFLTYDGRPKKLGFFERRRLAKGIKELEAIATDERGRIWWFLGMARRSAGDPTGAFDAFERAYRLHPEHPDVSREFGGQCLALGRGERAVVVCERNCILHPRDAGLRSNLALACMIAGDMARAKVEVTRALEMDPEDDVSRALAKMIDEVVAGKRARLTKYP